MLKDLDLKQVDVSLVSWAHIKREEVCNPDAERVETGESPSLSASQPSLLVELLSRERPCLKKENGRCCLRKNTKGYILESLQLNIIKSTDFSDHMNISAFPVNIWKFSFLHLTQKYF